MLPTLHSVNMDMATKKNGYSFEAILIGYSIWNKKTGRPTMHGISCTTVEKL